jgi:hypothetical protein
MPDCPLSLEVLPPNLRKHVDPAAAQSMRMMAAKSMVPMSPLQVVTALFMLSFDPDPEVSGQARDTAAALPDRILAVALRDNSIHGETLDFLAASLPGKTTYLEWICLNASSLDPTLARIAADAPPALCDLISQNQLRLLRHEPLLRALLGNSQALRSTIDGTADFAVRSGIFADDVPALVEARKRVFGEAPALDLGPTAEQMVSEFQVGEEEAAPLPEGKRLTFTQKIIKMTVSQRIKLAMMGNKEARSLLLRDANKLVALAAVQSPRITDGEVLALANSRTAHEEVLRSIYQDREWTKSYQVKMALVKNPKVPLPVAMRFLPLLHDSDIKDLSRSKNIPTGVRNQARSMIAKREAPKQHDD